MLFQCHFTPLPLLHRHHLLIVPLLCNVALLVCEIVAYNYPNAKASFMIISPILLELTCLFLIGHLLTIA